MERTKYHLPSNGDLSVELERRRFGGVDRTWSVREFNLFLATCMADGHEDFAAIAQLQQYIYRVRPQIQDEDSTRPMTHHGLCHSFAARPPLTTCPSLSGWRS